MQILKFDHPALLVSDVEKSRYFYGQILGLQEVSRPERFDFPGAWYQLGQQQLHLVGEKNAERVAQVNPGYNRDELARGHCTHIAFEVPDLQAAMQHLHAHNIEIVGGPRPRGDGVQQMYICDPDGYVVEIFTWETRNP